MATREEFLDHLWTGVIDTLCRDQGLDNIVAHCRRFPGGPFSDTGGAVERVLAAGASRRDLCLIMRATAYEAVFGTLYALSEPGLDRDEDASTLFEDLLSADPSGREGRPGSDDAS